MLAVRIIWSCIAWLIALIGFIAVVLLALPLSLFRPFETFQGGWPSAIIGRTPLLTLSRFTIREDPRHDASRVCLYVMNHTSVLDGPVAVGALPHPFCGIENAGHLLLPGYGWLMKMANAIPVHKGEGRTEILKKAVIDRVQRGISVLAFPEAHRTIDGRVRPFRRGVFFLARAAGIPVVPVGVRGLRTILPKGTLVVRPGAIEVYIGPPLETHGLSDDEIVGLAASAQTIVSRYVESGETVDGLSLEPKPPVPHRKFRTAVGPSV